MSIRRILPSSRPRFPFLPVIAAGIVLSASAVAQDAPPRVAAAPNAEAALDGLPSVDTVQGRLAAVEADATLDEAFRNRLEMALRNTLEQLRNLEVSRTRREAHTQAAATAPARIDEVRETLEQDPPPVTLPPEATDPTAPLSLDAYRTRRTEAEANLNAARDELQELTTLQRERAQRAAMLGSLIAETRQTIETLSAPIPPVEGDPQGMLQAAREDERAATLAAARARLAALQAEQTMIEAESELLPLRVQLARREIDRAEELLRLWTEALRDQKQYRIESDLADYRRQLIGRQLDPERSLVLALAQQWTRAVVDTAATRRSLSRRRAQLDELSATFDEAQAEIARDLETAAGLRSGLGMKLQRIRRRLPATAQLRDDIRAVDEAIEHTRYLQTTVELALEDAQDDLTGGTMFRPDIRLPMRNGSVHPVEIELLERMRADIEDYLGELIELKEVLELRSRKVRQLGRLIDRNVVWIRDAVPLRFASFYSAWRALQWVFHPRHLRDAGEAMIRGASQRIDLIVLWTVAALVPWAFGPRLRRRLDTLNRNAPSMTRHAMAAAGSALFLSFVLALPLAVTLAVLGGSVLHEARHDAFLHALGGALLAAGGALLPVRWLGGLLRPGGVADSQFGFDRETIRPAHHALIAATVVIVPFVLLWRLASSPAVAQADDSLGRIVFVLGMMALTAIGWRALDPRSGVTAKCFRDSPEGWAYKLQWLWRDLSLLPLGLAVLSAVGYSYAATLLAERLYWTLWFAAALVVGGGMLRRWVHVRRLRRLRSEERPTAEEPLRPAGDAEEADVASVAGEPMGDDVELETPSIGTPNEVDAQTTRLLTALLWVVILVGAAWLWEPVLPALRFLDRVQLGSTTEIDGSIVPITLAHLVTAIPIVFVTWVAARNIPGLFESFFLERLPLDKAARYAITTLASYAIAILGIMLTARMIGLRWEGIQWLVAALGVGLGFGLQEIFANFVSGLILLFEQPVRVGDVVTIGDTTGIVAKIRIRSTVVTNWDRQELIIPNKTLITDRLINWTLSDTTNRIELRIGVAYGTDTQVACRLLEEICNQHDDILVDPKPMIIFDSFGDSTLNLVVRCFLSRLDQRLPTIHQLNTTIAERFREAGIEIAFPQQDLHIRSLPPNWHHPAEQAGA